MSNIVGSRFENNLKKLNILVQNVDLDNLTGTLEFDWINKDDVVELIYLDFTIENLGDFVYGSAYIEPKSCSDMDYCKMNLLYLFETQKNVDKVIQLFTDAVWDYSDDMVGGFAV